MLNEAITRQDAIPDSVLTAMGRRAYDDVLGNLRACHAKEPNLGTSIRLNRCITDMFWIAPGKTRNAVLVDGDVSKDVTNLHHVETVFLDGYCLDANASRQASGLSGMPK